ncbi:MAG: hypothetical protein H6883_06690 [Rhodobiaceae bacterium]|nr:hypothetical protein [Rhodobiaceae bacterium]
MAAAAAFLIAAGTASAGTLEDLISEYRCPLIEKLEKTHMAYRAVAGRDRFLSVSVPEHPHGYVQCLFHDGNRQLHCEAASGYFSAQQYRLPADRVAALGRLGFATGVSDANYGIDFDMPLNPDFDRLARLLLTALHDGYGARAATRLRINAPFVPSAAPACAPVS